jgi:hypothetical protein
MELANRFRRGTADNLPAAHRAQRAAWRAELLRWQRRLTLTSLNEIMRLFESGKFRKLTSRHVLLIAEYRPITIDDETFFDKAFSRSKEVAACLGFAMEHGWNDVLDDLACLRAILQGPASLPV